MESWDILWPILATLYFRRTPTPTWEVLVEPRKSPSSWSQMFWLRASHGDGGKSDHFDTPKFKGIVLYAYDSKALNDEEFALLYDVTRPKNPDVPYWRYPKFDLEGMSDDECKAEFRFSQKRYIQSCWHPAVTRWNILLQWGKSRWNWGTFNSPQAFCIPMQNHFLTILTIAQHVVQWFLQLVSQQRCAVTCTAID